MKVILTEQDIFAIIADCTSRDFKGVAQKIEELYDYQLLHSETVDIRNALSKFNAYKKRKFGKHAVDIDELIVMGSTEKNMLEIDIVEVPDDEKQPQTCKTKDFKNLSRKQQLRRMENLWKLVKAQAAQQHLTTEETLGFLLTRNENKNTANSYGKKLFEGEQDVTKLTVTTAVTVYLECNLGRSTYNKQRKLLSKNGFDIFPKWTDINNYQKKITPDIKLLEAPFEGVSFDFIPAFQMTTQRLLQAAVDVKADEIVMKMKYGFDGSGSHAIYHQKNNLHTNNMILSVFCPLQLKSGDTEIWTEIAPNTPNTQRPYLLQLGKESYEACKAQSPVQKDIKDLEQNGIQLEGKQIKIQAHLMCDRKASDLFFGNGGAFCDLCTKTKIECESIDTVKNGFEIEKTVEQLHNIFNSLQDEGEIVKTPGDFAVRQGQCHKPIAEHEVRSTQVLHGLLRTFDHFMNAVLRCYAGVYSWGAPKASWSRLILDQQKKCLQDTIEKETGIRWDQPDPTGKGGTTTTGNIGRQLLHSHRNVIVSVLPEKHKELFEKWGYMLSAIIRTVSSKRKLRVDKLKEVCTELYVLMLKELPWISITPTVHKFLGHSWECVLENDDTGLGSLDESGLEGCNKILCRFRTSLSRKRSQMENLTDVLSRLWVNSDPIINLERQKMLPSCKICKVAGHSTRYCKAQKVLSEDDLVQYLML